MITRTLAALIFATLAWLSIAGTAMAQSKGCTVEQAPPLDFGSIGANPTAEVNTSTALTVRCTGTGNSERGATIKVCITLDGQTPTREMANGAAVPRLAYQIRRSPTEPVTVGQTFDGQLVLDQSPQPTGVTTIPLYGVITEGQMGLGAGTYTEFISGSIRSVVSSDPDAVCTSPIWETLNTSASAILPDRCSIVADDLAFGSHFSLAGGVSATAAIQLVCTNNTAYSVSIDGGASGDPNNRLMRRNGVGPESLSYSLYRDAGHTEPWGNTPGTLFSGVGTGSPDLLTVYGLVPDQPPPLSGDYRDTVVVTVGF